MGIVVVVVVVVYTPFAHLHAVLWIMGIMVFELWINSCENNLKAFYSFLQAFTSNNIAYCDRRIWNKSYTKLPWQPYIRLSVKMTTKFKNAWMKMSGHKKTLWKTWTHKRTSRKTLTGICQKSLKNFELYEPNLRSKHLREWSSQSIRSRINMSKIQDC